MAILINCRKCSIEFWVIDSRTDAKFCSRLCKSDFQKGKTFNEEVRKKMSQNSSRYNLGRKFSEEHCRRIRESHIGMKGKTCSPEQRLKISIANTGKKRSEETKKKLSLLRKGKKFKGVKWSEEARIRNSGPNCHAWKGGISSENNRIRHTFEYTEWRKSVFERDNYRCVLCGKGNINGERNPIQADHIKPFALYPDLRFLLENGRTLCINCHKNTDTYCRKTRY